MRNEQALTHKLGGFFLINGGAGINPTPAVVVYNQDRASRATAFRPTRTMRTHPGRHARAPGEQPRRQAAQVRR